MEATEERKVLNLLGLGLRGRLVVVGVEQVKEAVRRGTVQVAVLGTDASPNSREKVTRLLAARGVPTIEIASAAALGEAVGKATTAVVGVVDRQLAEGIVAATGNAVALQSGSRRKG